MKMVWIAIALFSLLGAVDMEKLRSYKQAYKQSARQAKQIRSSTAVQNRIMVIFKHYKKDIEVLELQYPIYLKQCIAKKACIFLLREGEIEVESLIKKILREQPLIQSVQRYRRYHFKPL